MPDQTSVTRHITWGRLKKLEQILGVGEIDKLPVGMDGTTLADVDDRTRDDLLAGLCVAWFGPIGPTAPRSDRGGTHHPPEHKWLTICRYCDGEFYRTRPDAAYCSARCRQAAYRARRDS